jgi:fermentation-respiration switch protein FrsA (DUF1100 family)
MLEDRIAPMKLETSTSELEAARGSGKPLVWRWPLVALILIVAILAALYVTASAFFTDQATRAVRNAIEGTPADLGLSYEAVSFASAVARIPLQGWYLPAGGKRAIIIIHGIDKNRWDAWEHIPQKAQLFVQHGFDVLVFDLRGHGESGGERLGFGWLERNDVLGAVRYIEERGIPAGRIGLQSHSYGAGTGLLSAAAIPDVAAVVADSAFADIRPLLNHEVQLRGFPRIFTPGISFVGGHFYGLDLDEIPPEKQVSKIAPRPILFIHGTADDRIPVENSYRLFAAANNSVDELWIVPGAAHVQAFTVEPEIYSQKVVAFFDENLR